MNSTLAHKELKLKELLRAHDCVAVAFSGGVDSTLLLAVAQEVLGNDVVALTAKFSCSPLRDQQAAHSFCAQRNIRQLEFIFDEFSVEGFANNPPNRCYVCKRALLGGLQTIAHAQGITTLVEGSNLDDASDYRPGLVAVEELGIASPLKEAELTKEEVRTLARKRGLLAWNKPSCACLATRIPYGSKITPELVARIDAAEEYLFSLGAAQVRVRAYPQHTRIEVDAASIALLKDPATWSQVQTYLTSLGFEHIELDPQGYRTGSLNP